MSDTDVVVYYKPGCPFSAALFARMRLARIPYTAVRLQDDPDGAQKVRDVNDGNEVAHRQGRPELSLEPEPPRRSPRTRRELNRGPVSLVAVCGL